MTPLNLSFTILIAVLMAVASLGLGKAGKSRNPHEPAPVAEIGSDPVPLVSEADMGIVKKAKDLQPGIYPSQNEIDAKLAALKLEGLTATDFKEEDSLARLKSRFMPDPEEKENQKPDSPVVLIGKDELVSILTPHPDIDRFIEVTAGGKKVELVSLKEGGCWFSKDEMTAPPAAQRWVLAGTGDTAIDWNVDCKSPTEPQWLAALKVGKPDFNGLEGGNAEYLREGSDNKAKVIGRSDQANEERFEAAMTPDKRKNEISKTTAEKKGKYDREYVSSKATEKRVKDKIDEYKKGLTPKDPPNALKTIGYDYIARQLEQEDKNSNESKATETFAYRWVIPYPLP